MLRFRHKFTNGFISLKLAVSREVLIVKWIIFAIKFGNLNFIMDGKVIFHFSSEKVVTYSDRNSYVITKLLKFLFPRFQ